jgi:hypothetical protein
LQNVIKKHYISLAAGIIAFLAVSCHSSDSQKRSTLSGDISPSERPITIALTNYPQQYAVFSVADTTHDFGTVEEGKVVKYDFRFRNTGQKPLIISQASSTCGCTVPKFPKKPIAPGEVGYLHVVFNRAGKSGKQLKPIFIEENTKPRKITLSKTCNDVQKK